MYLDSLPQIIRQVLTLKLSSNNFIKHIIFTSPALPYFNLAKQIIFTKQLSHDFSYKFIVCRSSIDVHRLNNQKKNVSLYVPFLF